MSEEPDTDPVEPMLRQFMPDGPDAHLRAQVLGAVARELTSDKRHRRLRTLLGPGWLVAASIALGAGLNFWAMETERDRDTRLYGQRPTPRAIVEVVETVRSVTDRETASLMEKTLRAAWENQVSPPSLQWPAWRRPEIEKILNEPKVRG
jgi:hypothetical protein